MKRPSHRITHLIVKQFEPFRPIWMALRDIFGRRHATYYYRCANGERHPGTVVTWDAVHGSRDHNICPKCGAVAQSGVRKTKLNVRLQRLVRRLLHGV